VQEQSLQFAEAKKEAGRYPQTVDRAQIEFINRISKVENYGKSIVSKRQQLEALELSVDSATKLFQNARAEYVEVLSAQTALPPMPPKPPRMPCHRSR